jgi:hypothetical protein
MDIAAGHFAHMEFITSSELAFPFTREVADLARRTVKSARKRNILEMNNEKSEENRVWTNQDVEYWDNVSDARYQAISDFANRFQLDAMGAVDLDMEGWNIFSAIPVQGSPNYGNGISYTQTNVESRLSQP